MNINLEEKLENFCRFNCKYKYSEKRHGISVKDEMWSICPECDEENYFDSVFDIIPCEYCQVKEFVREIRDLT